jgi:hypothetical protein
MTFGMTFVLLTNSSSQPFGTPDRLLAEMNKETPTHREFFARNLFNTPPTHNSSSVTIQA